jgi:ribosomal protein S18 acetylase RimI-like enzyme
MGRALTKEVMRCKALRDMTFLQLNVLKTNSAAISFYEALGSSLIRDKGEKQVMQINLWRDMPHETLIW